MACRTMQLRLFKLGTVLTYAFNITMTNHLIDLKLYDQVKNQNIT